MATLQVKHLSDDLHDAVATQARTEGLTISQFVTRTLEREIQRLSVTDWIRHVQGRIGDRDCRPIDAVAALAEARSEYDPDERFDAR
jgi:post-segregation antitoxin (ccd killing protein)